MKYTVYQASRRGGREKNEDRIGYAYTKDALLLVLADGMGGHTRGEVAAELLLNVIAKMFESRATPAVNNVTEFLLDSIYAAHEAINDYALRHGMPDAPRTTCVVCVVQAGRAYWAHVGDSRLYHFSRERLLGRTTDHSMVQELVDKGLLDEAGMAIHPDRNKLYNCVGGFVLPNIELSAPVAPRQGDVLLLSSDGFWSEISPAAMLATLRAYPLEVAVNQMMDHAEISAGEGGDNLSVVAVRFGEELFKEDTTIQTDHLGLNVATQLYPRDSLAVEDELGSDAEIEQAIADIQAALRKHSSTGKNS